MYFLYIYNPEVASLMHIVVILGLNDRNAEISLPVSVFVDLKGKKYLRRHQAVGGMKMQI